MAFVGMSPDQIDTAARKVAGQADELQSVLGAVSGLVNQASGYWHGPDLDAFRRTWTADKPRVVAAIGTLRAMSAALNRQAAEQRTASAARGGVGGGGGGGAGGGAWPWSAPPMSSPPSTPVTQAMADGDPLVPGENAQHGIGDCWLISAFNAQMETEAGRAALRDGVRWNSDTQTYWVRLYEGGQEVWVNVANVFPDGMVTTANGAPGLMALYEAAVYERYGWDYLYGNSSAAGIMGITGESSQVYVRVDLGLFNAKISDDAIQSGGSADGGASLANTPGSYHGQDTITVPATPDPGSSGPMPDVTIHADHVYEVVDSKNGMIGLRNPWGTGNGADKDAQNAAGVFYISQADFDRAFSGETQTEFTGLW